MQLRERSIEVCFSIARGAGEPNTSWNCSSRMLSAAFQGGAQHVLAFLLNSECLICASTCPAAAAHSVATGLRRWNTWFSLPRATPWGSGAPGFW
jgi:hypothetical protein